MWSGVGVSGGCLPDFSIGRFWMIISLPRLLPDPFLQMLPYLGHGGWCPKGRKAEYGPMVRNITSQRPQAPITSNELNGMSEIPMEQLSSL